MGNEKQFFYKPGEDSLEEMRSGTDPGREQNRASAETGQKQAYAESAQSQAYAERAQSQAYAERALNPVTHAANGGFCPRCGTAVPKGAKFCKNCGTALKTNAGTKADSGTNSAGSTGTVRTPSAGYGPVPIRGFDQKYLLMALIVSGCIMIGVSFLLPFVTVMSSARSLAATTSGCLVLR